MIGALEDYLRGLGEATIAYSGGVDSTFLLATSARVLGAGHVLAVTMESPLTPPWEVAFAKEFCRNNGIKHHVLDGSFVLEDESVVTNPPQRCYYCKRRLLAAILEASPAHQPLLTGTNASDESDFRPGIRAEEEMGVSTPLRELRFTKEAIREYSRTYEIPEFERLPSPCFATRIPYGEPITIEKVRMIEGAETFLRQLGFALVRVRLFSADTACIEVAQEEIGRACDLHQAISRQLGTMGFKRVTLDLEGYQQGRLNVGITV